jgi:hypothetical protein
MSVGSRGRSLKQFSVTAVARGTHDEKKGTKKIASRVRGVTRKAAGGGEGAKNKKEGLTCKAGIDYKKPAPS